MVDVTVETKDTTPKEVGMKEVLQELGKTMIAMKLKTTPRETPEEMGAPVVVTVDDKRLLKVRVWEQRTYLVRCSPNDVPKVIMNPIERIGMVGDSEVAKGGIVEVLDATQEDLEAASSTLSIII